MKTSECKSINICNSNFLYNVLQSSRSSCLIFDIRDPAQILEKGTVRGAIHLKPLNTTSVAAQSEKGISLESLADCDLTQGVKDQIQAFDAKLLFSHCFRRRFHLTRFK